MTKEGREQQLQFTLQLLEKEQLSAMMTKSGFRIREVRTFRSMMDKNEIHANPATKS